MWTMSPTRTAPPPSEVPSRTLTPEEVPPVAAGSGNVPEGFDEEQFLKGAKAFCVRIRTAWNSRDLMDLREFCTEEGMEEFRRRAQNEARPPRQEILSINAGLVEVRDLQDDRQEAAVFYVIAEKDLSSNLSGEVHEIWRFVRTADTTWLLDGMRTVDAEEAIRQ